MIQTIGHSNHVITHFLALLKVAGIDCVADVRSVPFSRRHPQFGQKALAASLQEAGIEYWFLGDVLGARPKDPACYENGKASYARIAATRAFKDAIDSLIAASARKRVALMCAEKEPLDCHRTVLVGRALVQRDQAVSHILADGRVEAQVDIESRLLRRAGEESSLFGDRAAALTRAYDALAEKIAFAGEPPRVRSAVTSD